MAYATSTWIAIGLITAGVASGATATATQMKAASAQKKATKEQRQMEQMQRASEARERYRQMRRERASVQQTAEYLGASDSSSAIAAENTVSTAYDIGQGFANTTAAMADRMNAYTDKANKYNRQAQMWQSISNTAMSTASVFAGMPTTSGTKPSIQNGSLYNASGTFTNKPTIGSGKY